MQALAAVLIRRKLPESHLSDETKGVVTLSMGVVGGTLTALVLSLFDRHGKQYVQYQESTGFTVLAAKVIQLERLLQRYGPEADAERDLLHLYAAMKLKDFSSGQG